MPAGHFSTPRRLPLEGTRVLDFTVVWAGPFATMMLADLGAEVIRVESLQYIDGNTRGQPRPLLSFMVSARGNYYPDKTAGLRPWNRSAMFTYAGRHKLSFTVDLTRKEGLELFFQLANLSDVIMDNRSAKALRSLGITYDAVRRVRPDIVMIQLPNYGMTGPYAHNKGYGANVDAVAGHTWLRGYPDSDPTTTSMAYHADAAGGATTAFAVIAALAYRRRTGRGQYIDLSQAENVVHHLSQAVMDYSMNQRSQSTLGNRDPVMAPQGAYPCKGEDEWVAISIASDEEFARLCRVMGRPELDNDPRFATVIARHRNHDELDAIVSEWTRGQDHYEVMHKLQAQRIAAGPVLTPQETLRDPHLRARGLWQWVYQRDTGLHEYPGSVFRGACAAPTIRQPAPLLGQHNEHVYKELLGLSEQRYEWYLREKHVGDTPVSAVVAEQ